MKVTKKGKLSFRLPDHDLKVAWLSAAKVYYLSTEIWPNDHERYLFLEALEALRRCETTITLRCSEMMILTTDGVFRYMDTASVILLRKHMGNLEFQRLELPAHLT